eukprot:3495658-Rhodomonas_salina.1
MGGTESPFPLLPLPHYPSSPTTPVETSHHTLALYRTLRSKRVGRQRHALCQYRASCSKGQAGSETGHKRGEEGRRPEQLWLEAPLMSATPPSARTPVTACAESILTGVVTERGWRV